MTRYFHFTLGPVQGFVAQARRTRDFWAGSFILSWLAAVAMQAVRQQGGIVAFPLPDAVFLDALLGRSTNPPTQGTIPNRFKAEVPDGFDPGLVMDTASAAWHALAEHVWQADFGAQPAADTRSIWDRQIEGFWDIQWALVDDENESSILDRLKNWRTHAPPDEPGVKCMMMDGWQELSGAERPGRRAGDTSGPDAFWKRLRERGKKGMATDLREGEMLCAIAYVKRRFVRHFDDFEVALPGGWQVRGWPLPPGVPSVHYMAAAPWLSKLLQASTGADDQGAAIRAHLGDFHDAAYALTGGYGEWDSNIACVRRADVRREWKALDGTVFFDSMLENQRLWGAQPSQEDAKKVLRKLGELRKVANLDPVSSFYAVLLMDGDELGIHMSERAKQKHITKGLSDFTAKVPDIVREKNGFLVYAGGDDVLALLPLDDALGCAAALRAHYLDCFLKSDDVRTSLSGAIQYAHIKMPLGKVLHDAHDLLDRVAKDGRGRDAIACRVWKPGGLTVEWAMPWKCAIEGDQVVVDKLAKEFREGMSGEDGDMASKFLYRIRERFDLLNPPAGKASAVLDEDAAVELMAMEYLNSGLVRELKLGMGHATAKVRPLLDQCRPVTRDKNVEDHTQWQRSNQLAADGALLVRFLADKGVER
jgi:CRISPR-associated protein Cmr2